MASSSSSSSSSCNWSYDVFPSFSGEDIRKTFLSHFLKELDRKLIRSFKDSEIERGRSLDPELKQAILESRIAVVIFSKNYASSSWCLNELLEILRCKKELIPIFYHLDPSDVRKQTGEFGEIFDKTCQNKTEDEKFQWREALTNIANILEYHIVTWANEANMIEEIANEVLSKLNLTPSDDFKEFVGIEDHIKKMSSLLCLESQQVRMVGIWGASGIGKTIIARALLSRLSHQFQSSVFIDRDFISTSIKRADVVDYNTKLHLQRNFLAKLLGHKDIKIDHIGGIENMLKHRKTLVVIDDLDDQDVLDAIAGQTQWFGNGSRIIVVTKNKHLLRAHGIENIYEVCLPSYDLALEMFCRSAFRKNSPPDGFFELASQVVSCAGNLPLGLNVLGASLRGRDKEYWTDMLPGIRNGLDEKIEKTLRVGYEELNNKKDKAIFRHVACLFNGEKVDDIKMLLADSNMDVNIGLKNLVDKSLIHQRHHGTVEMHSLLQELGKEIVRAQSDEPGEREFLMDSKDICDVLEENTGTKKVLGIALNLDEIDELDIHESAFKEMKNLLFLKISSREWYMKREWHLPDGFDYFPPKLRLLSWDNYPGRSLPTSFRPKNLVKVQMRESKLEKLWDGALSLTTLKNMDLRGSKRLKQIPDLSKATSLENLNLSHCSSLVELPSSIQHLNKLKELDMSFCDSLETLPSGINLKSLNNVNLEGCFLLRTFPDISTNISELSLNKTGIEEVPWWIENFSRLGRLYMYGCKNLLNVSLNMTKLKHLHKAEFSECGALTESSWNDTSSEVAMSTDDIQPKFLDEDSCSHPDGYFSMINLSFTDCLNFDPEALINQQSSFMELILLGEQVPSYFTHRTTGTSLTNISLPQISPSQPVFSFRCCAVVDAAKGPLSFEIKNCFRFVDRFGSLLESVDLVRSFSTEKLGCYLVIYDCYFPLNEEITPLLDQLKNGHMDIEFRIVREESQLQLKGCGIQFPDRQR